MTSEDWTCNCCCGTLLKTSKDYLVCENRCGKLIPAPRVFDLTRAIRVDYKRFRLNIKGSEELWEYVPHAHKNALDHAPAPGEMVARVWAGKKFEARTFRPAKPPRWLR